MQWVTHTSESEEADKPIDQSLHPLFGLGVATMIVLTVIGSLLLLKRYRDKKDLHSRIEKDRK